jgi:uncharacterized protein (DUF885 family)
LPPPCDHYTKNANILRKDARLIGERYWLAARETAKRAKVAAFDLKAFHAIALNIGPMELY